MTNHLHFVRIWRACFYTAICLLPFFPLFSKIKMAMLSGSHLLLSAYWGIVLCAVLSDLRWGEGETLFSALLQPHHFACELWSLTQLFPRGLIASTNLIFGWGREWDGWVAEGVSLELLSLSLGLQLFQPCSLLSLSKCFKDHHFSLWVNMHCVHIVCQTILSI